MGISTIFNDLPMVGKIGHSFGEINRNFLGYIGYVYPFLLIYPAYKIYKNEIINIKNIPLFGISLIFLIISILTFQGLIVDKEAGVLSEELYNFFSHYIGKFGTILFIIISFILSANTLFDISIDEVVQKNKDKIANNLKNSLLNFNMESSSDKELINLALSKEDIKKMKEEKKDISLSSNKNIKVKEENKDEIIDVAYDEIEKELKKVIHHKEKDEKKVKDKDIVKKVKEEKIDTKKEKIKSTDETIHKLHEDVEKLEKEIKKIEKIDKKVEENPKTSIKKTIILKEIDENKKLLEKTIKKVDQKDQKQNKSDFKLPSIDFLNLPPKKHRHINEAEIDRKIEQLLEKLRQFKINGDIIATYSGPVVTTFEFKPAANIKVSKILTLQDDLAMALKAKTIRIQAPIPGKDVIGIEIPNDEIETIYLREVLDSELFKMASSPLTMVIGKDIVGNPFVTDLKKLPHLLIAGTTGSGKSVGINAMLISLLYRNSPDNLKLLMIDPKMLEFSIYNDIPHLLTPVITESKKAIFALANMVVEMERRYKLMSKTKTKNIENYNEKAKKEGLEQFPYIVVIIDELADLMMTSGKDVEFYIARLAQMARASGIHLIVATQRPSVDVVTGLIKANLPSRMSFKVGQKIDSKVILDSTGADALLGRGDMLFTPPGSNSLVRLHAPFVTEEEIEKIVEFLKSQREVEYDERFLSEPNPDGTSVLSTSSNSPILNIDGEFDELFDEAKKIILSDKKTSISYLQRKLNIGYNRSAKIIEQLQQAGILSAPNHKGQREIII